MSESKRNHAVIIQDPAKDAVLVYAGKRGLGTLEFDADGTAYWTNAVSAWTSKIEHAFVPLNSENSPEMRAATRIVHRIASGPIRNLGDPAAYNNEADAVAEIIRQELEQERQ